jgi:hypothetical protein
VKAEAKGSTWEEGSAFSKSKRSFDVALGELVDDFLSAGWRAGGGKEERKGKKNER